MSTEPTITGTIHVGRTRYNVVKSEDGFTWVRGVRGGRVHVVGFVNNCEHLLAFRNGSGQILSTPQGVSSLVAVSRDNTYMEPHEADRMFQHARLCSECVADILGVEAGARDLFRTLAVDSGKTPRRGIVTEYGRRVLSKEQTKVNLVEDFATIAGLANELHAAGL